MNRRSRQIDLGPIIFPIASDVLHGEKNGGYSRDDISEDAIKLKELLCNAHRDFQQESDFFVTDESFVNSSNELDLSDRRNFNLFERYSKLMSAGTVAVSAARECGVSVVRLELHSDLLPETTMTVEDSGAKWIFSLHISNEQAARRLAQDVSLLAFDVGPRLHRPIEIRVFIANQPNSPFRTAHFDLRSRQ